MICGVLTALLKYLKKMQKNNKNSILIISHQERILDIADEIVLLADGVIKAHGSKEEILPMVLGAENNGPCANYSHKEENHG